MASMPVLSFDNGLQHPIYVYSKAQLREQMELSSHVALLHDRHFQDILPHVDSEAVVPFRDAHLAVVRPEDVRVDPVELGKGDYDTAFQCQVRGSYGCVIKISNNNVRPDWHPTSTSLKQRGAVEYVPLLSVATYSITPAFCSGFETELQVAKRLFEPFPSSSRQHVFLTIEEARHMALAYSNMQAHPGFPHAHRILRVEPAPRAHGARCASRRRARAGRVIPGCRESGPSPGRPGCRATSRFRPGTAHGWPRSRPRAPGP